MTGASPIVLNAASAVNARRKADVLRARLIETPAHPGVDRDWRDDIAAAIQPHERVLDIGKSSRHAFEAISARAAVVHTLDINAFDGYPDYLADICQPIPAEHHGGYDVVIALAILESAYDPQAMIDNLARLLRPGGRAHIYAPFLYAYHAPKDLGFQDYWRFTRDGLAYLLRDWADVELQGVRGQFSTIANLFPAWKVRVEPRFGWLGRWLDGRADPRRNRIDVSGYNVTAWTAVSGARARLES